MLMMLLPAHWIAWTGGIGMTERADVGGILAAVREGQQQVALAALRIAHAERDLVAAHLINAQRRLAAAEIDLVALMGASGG
jgi:hypothetical protein